MSAAKWIRQGHRWMSMAFTAGFIFNVLAVAGGEEPAFWVYLLVLIPLGLLLASGLYLFVLPHVLKWRGGLRAGGKVRIP
jgi:hypothetical protein